MTSMKRQTKAPTPPASDLAKLAAKGGRLDPDEVFKAIKKQYPNTLARLAE